MGDVPYCRECGVYYPAAHGCTHQPVWLRPSPLQEKIAEALDAMLDALRENTDREMVALRLPPLPKGAVAWELNGEIVPQEMTADEFRRAYGED